MSNGSFASVWKAKLIWHFHLCNVCGKGLHAAFHHVFLMLSNTEREENGNMNQWSHFPSHILPQAEMMSEFTRKTSLSGTNISEEEIQRKLTSIKKWCWWFNRQHPYCKISNEPVSVWCMAVIAGSLGFHKRGGASVQGPYRLPRQPNPEGTVRLAPYTFKSSNVLLICKSHTGLVTAVISDSSQDVLVPYLDLSGYQVWSWLATISYAILFSTEASVWGKIWWVWEKRGRGKIYPFFPLVVTF